VSPYLLSLLTTAAAIQAISFSHTPEVKEATLVQNLLKFSPFTPTASQESSFIHGQFDSCFPISEEEKERSLRCLSSLHRFVAYPLLREVLLTEQRSGLLSAVEPILRMNDLSGYNEIGSNTPLCLLHPIVTQVKFVDVCIIFYVSFVPLILTQSQLITKAQALLNYLMLNSPSPPHCTNGPCGCSEKAISTSVDDGAFVGEVMKLREILGKLYDFSKQQDSSNTCCGKSCVEL